MNGWEQVIVLVVVIGAVLIVLTYTVDAMRKRGVEQDERWEARLDREREHELALADREVQMWSEAQKNPTPRSFGEALVGRQHPPKLVGRSQVLARPGSVPLGTTGDAKEGEAGWIDLGQGVHKGTGDNAGVEEREQP